jgi:hypothetical protein
MNEKKKVKKGGEKGDEKFDIVTTAKKTKKFDRRL